jgi:hypothetical protein
MERTPAKPLHTTWEHRSLLNLAHRGLPAGDLEFGRPGGSTTITWCIEYPPIKYSTSKGGLQIYTDDGKSFIYFNSVHKVYGGPFRFLSNFYPSEFFAQRIYPTHVFHSMEQFYQYAKACYICVADERLTDFDGMQVSSHKLKHYILATNDPGLRAFVGRAFAHLEEDEPDWWKQWIEY